MGNAAPSGATKAATPFAIEARNVTKTFGAGAVVAVEGANFEIPRGRFVSFVGPSGCGKSTILRMIAGLEPTTSGELLIHGQPVRDPRPDVGVMFQKPTLLEWYNVLDNVLLPVRLAGHVTRADQLRALDLIRLAGLQGFEFAFPQQLSGGMQQRVALARVLMAGADTLLLDEPFGALDEFTRERLNVELQRIVTEVGATTIFITHSIVEAIFLADTVVVMTPRPGRVASIIPVDLPRPRDVELQQSAEFNAIVMRVRNALAQKTPVEEVAA